MCWDQSEEDKEEEKAAKYRGACLAAGKAGPMLQRLLQLQEWWFPQRQEWQWIHNAAGRNLGTHWIQACRNHYPTRSEIIWH